MRRYLHHQILKDLDRKMVFVGGPRQVGKTTLAKQIINEIGGAYLNWDIPEHRDAILHRSLPQADLWCFDEIHKYDRWRDFLKGLFDQYQNKKKILVTGSARLDFYKYSGDSLQGRYHYLRLHPLSLSELRKFSTFNMKQLFELGGFPEPYFSQSVVEARRWSIEYRKRLFEEDVRSLENLRSLGSIELLATRLPALVGSPLSINSLREDLQITHKTATHWIEILERMYHIFRIYPFGSPQIRAVKKEAKHYHFDWGVIREDGARFENLIAVHLQKWIHYRQDTLGEEVELKYFRDKDQREVDFIITELDTPTLFIECKLSSRRSTPKHLRYLKRKFPKVRSIQICFEKCAPHVDADGIQSMDAEKFLAELI